MEEVQKASLAYYNASKKEKKHAKKAFEKMDADGDGKISVAEFSNFLSNPKLKRFNENLFGQLDMDDDGYLDFDEALLFHYISRTRPTCSMCGSLILGMYYSCPKCFHRFINWNGKPCDLCPSCHSLGTFQHKHRLFLDNYALLRNKDPLETFGRVLWKRFTEWLHDAAVENAIMSCTIM